MTSLIHMRFGVPGFQWNRMARLNNEQQRRIYGYTRAELLCWWITENPLKGLLVYAKNGSELTE